MAEATEGPRLNPDLVQDDEAVRSSNVRDLAKGTNPQNTAPPPADFTDYNAGNFFDPMSGGLPAFTESEAPWWSVSDDESPYYDIYNPGGHTEASSTVQVRPGVSIGLEEGYGEPNPGTGPLGSRPVDPSLPSSLRSVHEQYWRMDPKTRAEWQQRMYEAGFLKDEPAVWGQPDPRGHDFDGWANMAKTAARLNIPMSELAEQLAAAGAGDAMRGGGPKRRIPDVQLTNSMDAKRMAEAIGVELMGRAPTDEETQRAVARLHSLERSGGSRMQSAAASETGGSTFEGTVSAQTALESSLEASAPEEVAAHDQVEQFAGFLSLLGGA